ncbi:MAG TPA: patatin-like phospholipase family protein [Xanthobacteraceae bacterium]|jgi:NTE family protein|nr:patatin-like phospholipase family protein [Xanthobacteraceae bacterium]
MIGFLKSLLPNSAAPSAASPKTDSKVKHINLALQGGGAHGAFTWGVLEQLLSDERLVIEGISGTSAGAVNAVMLADGLGRGGREEASKRLADFWRAVSSTGSLPSLQRAVMERLLSFAPLEGSPAQAWFNAVSRYLSPYDVNPLNISPLKELIESFVDFEALRANTNLQLFISATNVQTGRVRIFPREKITAEAVMASACLPMIFRAVEIDDVPYWDGGYLGNPVIFPFFRSTSTEDVLVVQINPLVREETPMSSSEIMNRINEITFNSSLIGEYRTIDFITGLIDDGKLPRGLGEGQYRRINVHRIVLDRFGTHFDSFGKLSTDYEFFDALHVSGKRAARRFLDEHFDDIGNKSTVDLQTEARAEWA